MGKPSAVLSRRELLGGMVAFSLTSQPPLSQAKEGESETAAISRLRNGFPTTALPLFRLRERGLGGERERAGGEGKYHIAVCDWMILKRQKLGAFALTREIGADGVEVDMGGLGTRETFDNSLAAPAVRKQFLDKAQEMNLRISSLAMSGFYAQSFAERPGVERMVQDCLDTAKELGVKTVFLPLGVGADLTKKPELRPTVVSRLKAIAPRAQAAGVVVGIETSLSAKDEVALLEDIGSPFVRSYFNFENALQAGRDLYEELQTLGKDRIAQIHCTNKDGVWLQDDKQIDLPRVRKTLNAMGWNGWLVIERSRRADDARNVKRNFGANAAYLKSVFQNG